MADGWTLAGRLAVWLALVGYFAGTAALLARGARRTARKAYAVGIAAMVVHILVALGHHHGWSQAEAWRFTAERSEEVVGVRAGYGLLVNYLFVGVWLAETLLLGRPRLPTAAAGVRHGLLLFVVVNATVVFETGPARWLGVAGCAVLLAAGWGSRRRRG